MMRRCSGFSFWLISAAALLLAGTSHRGLAQAPTALQADKPVTAKPVALLQRPFDTTNFRTYMNLGSFFEALPDNLAKQGIPLKIVVDANAFEDEHTGSDSPFDAHLQFPSDARKMTVAQALRFALSKLPDDNGAFVAMGDHVLVTTKKRASITFKLKQPLRGTFEDCPLSTALQQLAESTGTTIVLAPQAGKQAQQRVSAEFRNDVTLGSAIRVLAEMADLKAVVLEGVVFVTTPAHVEALMKER
jgi:hypothetical protein